MEELRRLLEQSAEDFRLSSAEKKEIEGLLEAKNLNLYELNRLRDKLFRIAVNLTDDPKTKQLLGWLDRSEKLLDLHGRRRPETQVFFSPGPDCRKAICDALAGAKKTVDICVFTISDDLLAEHLLAAHHRGVRVRLITDNDKSHDKGSDIAALAHAGLPCRVDGSPEHMHHKFAVIDKRILITGSYNWTRSAFVRNFENLLITDDVVTAAPFISEFERLWELFENYI